MPATAPGVEHWQNDITWRRLPLVLRDSVEDFEIGIWKGGNLRMICKLAVPEERRNTVPVS